MKIVKLTNKLSIVEGSKICIRSLNSNKVQEATICKAFMNAQGLYYMLINFGAWEENYRVIPIS